MEFRNNIKTNKISTLYLWKMSVFINIVTVMNSWLVMDYSQAISSAADNLICWHMFLKPYSSWWRHQVETFSALHLCGEFTGPRWIPHTKASDAELYVFFDLCLNKLRKQSRGWWFETLSWPLWRHRNDGHWSIKAWLQMSRYICKQRLFPGCIEFTMYIMDK